MANIVELRETSDEQLEEMLENAREEIFNLRFRKASGQLEDYSRLKEARREIAQVETVLHMRQLAIATAVSEPAIASVLAGKEWEASAAFDYEESAWQVEFADKDGNDLASAAVNLNKKQNLSKRQEKQKGRPKLLISYEIAE